MTTCDNRMLFTTRYCVLEKGHPETIDLNHRDITGFEWSDQQGSWSSDTFKNAIEMNAKAEQAERDGTLGDVIDRRVQVYGEVIPSFVDIARVWSGICGFEIQPTTVPLMMVGMKAVRARVMPEYSDNSDDIDGYMDIFRTLVGEDMIHARTVNEFIEQRWPS